MKFINLKDNMYLKRDLLSSVENNSDWTEILEWLKEQINIVGVNKLILINFFYKRNDIRKRINQGTIILYTIFRNHNGF